MIELFRSVYTLMTTYPSLSALTDVYLAQADEDAVFPYMVFSFPTETEGPGTFELKQDDILVQFDIISDKRSATQAVQIKDALVALMHQNHFSVDNHDICHIWQGPSNLVKWQVDGKKVWQYMIQYNLKLTS